MELKPFGRCTVKMARSSTIVIEILARGINAPTIAANPPSNSTRIIAHDSLRPAPSPAAVGRKRHVPRLGHSQPPLMSNRTRARLGTRLPLNARL